jgi:hypothetical protein
MAGNIPPASATKTVVDCCSESGLAGRENEHPELVTMQYLYYCYFILKTWMIHDIITIAKMKCQSTENTEI